MSLRSIIASTRVSRTPGKIESRRADLKTADLLQSYEFACTRPSPSSCVRKLRLFRRFWVLLARLLVHCVLSCTSPVAVPVAVNTFKQTTISKGFLFSGLLCVTPYCVPGGVRVVPISLSYPLRRRVPHVNLRPSSQGTYVVQVQVHGRAPNYAARQTYDQRSQECHATEPRCLVSCPERR